MPKARNQSITIRNAENKATRTAVTPPPAPDLRQVFPVVPEAKGEMRATGSSNEGPSRDAWLIELCREWTEINVESDRLYGPAGDTRQGSPEWAAYDRFQAQHGDRWSELKSAIFVTPARTQEGLAAKAKVADRFVVRNSLEEPFEQDDPLASLVADILTWRAAA